MPTVEANIKSIAKDLGLNIFKYLLISFKEGDFVLLNYLVNGTNNSFYRGQSNTGIYTTTKYRRAIR